MADEQPTFTATEILRAAPCIHSVRRYDCAGCIRGLLWYEGRIAGLQEAADLLATNSAMVDAMKTSVHVAMLRRPGWHGEAVKVEQGGGDVPA